jgi:hypothetical protein
MAAAMSLFTVHFAMLGSSSGAIQNALGVARNLLILLIPAGTKANRIAEAVILSLFGLIPVFEWFLPFLPFSWWDLLPAVAMVIGSLLFWSAQSKKIRIAQLFVISPCWLTYDIVFRSFPGMVTEIFNMTSVLVAFFRFRRLAKDEKNKADCVKKQK